MEAEIAAQKKGRVRIEKKGRVITDGDMVSFRFNACQ
ncbi:MAG: DUF933 domain-containing protein [Syntrophales bacterium]|nr:DUF933 domain-containing protein [Syntrophales bacterium]